MKTLNPDDDNQRQLSSAMQSGNVEQVNEAIDRLYNRYFAMHLARTIQLDLGLPEHLPDMMRRLDNPGPTSGHPEHLGHLWREVTGPWGQPGYQQEGCAVFIPKDARRGLREGDLTRILARKNRVRARNAARAEADSKSRSRWKDAW